MKKHTLFFIALLCTLVCKADDYTTYLTSARGFTEVTSTSGLLTGDYYYVIGSAENTEMIVSVGRYEAKPSWAPETTRALRYKAVTSDPVVDHLSLFTIEKRDEYYALFSTAYPLDAVQTHGDASYMYVNSFTCQGDNVKEWGGLTPAWNNGFWTFEEGKYPGNFLGPWNKIVANDEAIAGNRTNAADDLAGHYRLFRIAKADLRNAQMAALQNASDSNPLDATCFITNPSFETGDYTGWTATGDTANNGEIGAKTSVTTNGDGNFTFNTFEWWSSLSVSQTAYVPSGIYDISAVVAAWEIDEVTFSAGSASITSQGQGDMTGIPVTLQSVLVGANNSLTISANKNTDWWSSGRSTDTDWRYACGFFKLDNVQLVCKGLFLGAIAEPLPNNTTTVLTPGQWYYYDVPASGKYTLTGNLKGLEYTQETNVLIPEVTANPTKEEMGFTLGRVFFKTKRNDATLKVDPAMEIKTFTMASMNVDGLPLTLSFPIVGDKDINPDGPGSTGTGLISSYITNRKYDLIAFQEDFNYDTELRSNMGGYTFGTKRASITTNIVYEANRPADTDGLQFAARNAAASFANESITRFNSSHSQDVVNVSLFKQEVNIVDGNSLIKKGFRYYEVTVGGEKLDVFITHTDAGTNDGSSTDSYVISREAQMKQIAQAILAKGNPDRPKILMGDTNCRWTREDLKANFFNILSDTYDVGDAWVELNRSGVYPTVGQSTISDEVVDKFFYINPKGTNKMKLTPVNILYDSENYIKTDGTPLSDHTPVVATFSLALYEEVDNHVQTDIVGDDGWDSADIIALVNILVGKTDSSYNMDAADVNGDGEVTLADLTELVNITR